MECLAKTKSYYVWLTEKMAPGCYTAKYFGPKGDTFKAADSKYEPRLAFPTRPVPIGTLKLSSTERGLYLDGVKSWRPTLGICKLVGSSSCEGKMWV